VGNRDSGADDAGSGGARWTAALLSGRATITVTDDNFEEVLLKSDKPVLVGVLAVWDGPSRQVAPSLEAIATERDEIVIAKLDTDENPATTAKYGVLSVPTMIVYKGGEVVKTIAGTKPKAALERDLAVF
jgi:thioredoxin 1